MGLGIRSNNRAHPATGSSEGHLDIDIGALIDFRKDTVVNETEVDDVDRDLGIEDLLHLVPDLLFEGGIREALGFLLLLFFFVWINAEGIGITRRDTGKPGGGGNGVGSSEGLGDYDGSSGGQGDGVAGGDLNRVDFAGKADFFVHDFLAERSFEEPSGAIVYFTFRGAWIWALSQESSGGTGLPI